MRTGRVREFDFAPPRRPNRWTELHLVKFCSNERPSSLAHDNERYRVQCQRQHEEPSAKALERMSGDLLVLSRHDNYRAARNARRACFRWRIRKPAAPTGGRT
jgi:hypothetical protein